MLDQGLLERVLRWIEAHRGTAHLEAARRAFEAATGTIEEGTPDYEPRIAHFLEQFLCGESEALSVFVTSATDLAFEARRELAGWARSHRSLFAFVGFAADGGRLRDCVGGGVFRFWPTVGDSQLTSGDRFDARLVPLGERLYLSPGRVYHPQEAHAALDALLPRLDLDSLAPRELLDGLLLMRSRYLSFASVRAEHVYQAQALAPVHLPLRAQ